MKINSKKVGILGGTFDPPHIGHLNISEIALKKFNLDKVIWLVTKQNPLKEKTYLSADSRIKLSKNILKNHKKISVKFMDRRIKSRSTFDLLYFLKKKKQKNKIFFFNRC